MIDKVIGMPPLEEPMEVCQSCVDGKHHRNSFPSSINFKATKPLELVYGDIRGPITPSTLGGSRYFLLLIDDYSRLIWVSMLKKKSEAFQASRSSKNLLRRKRRPS